jgi:homoserine O-acetyltransferase/O-succinyltransferase
MKKIVTCLYLLAGIFTEATAQQYYNQTEGDYYVNNFPFEDSNNNLTLLKLHYITLGTPVKDSKGIVTNAVLIMHGTGSNSRGFLGKQFGGLLFSAGQLLDAHRYYIILPDDIGHGKSSKPSDSLHMRFPNYTYDDMVKAEYNLITEHLGINHLRLVTGTSMGAMHTWMWGYMYPAMMDALMPLASLPVSISGRNRMMREMAIYLIENDPAWQDGEYKTPPVLGLSGAGSSLFFMNSSSYHLQQQAPTRSTADSYVEKLEKGYQQMDANNLIYQLQSSVNYDPSPYLYKIQAPLFAINSADDEINPPELGIMEHYIQQVPKGRYILLPFSPQTQGHGTNSLPAVWRSYLEQLLDIK